MFWPLALPRKSHFKAAAKMRAVKLENGHYTHIVSDSAEGSFPHDRNGDSSMSSVKIIVGADSEISVTNTRIVTSTALGILASKLYETPNQYIFDPLWKAITSFSGVQRQVVGVADMYPRLPYAELSRTYEKTRNEASQLVSVLESCGMPMPMDVDNLTPDDAVSFASKLPVPSNDGASGEDSVRK
ncbi:TATA-binding protein-associated factor BTAF1, partial [Tanacetum coccineum]